jgi:cobalt/nickel transport system permease protein
VDARVKLIVLVIWSVLLAVVTTKAAVVAGCIGSFLLAALAGALIRPSFYKRLFLVNSFLIFIWLILPFSFSVAGSSLYDIGPFTITREGLQISLTISLKAIAITMGALVILSSSSLNELVAASRSLGCPEKVMSFILLMTRYISVVSHEYKHLRDAMRIRGFKARCNKHSLKSIGNLCGMLLVLGVERAERVRAAMLCRGYKGHFWISYTHRLQVGDLFFVLLIVLLCALVLVGQWQKHLL